MPNLEELVVFFRTHMTQDEIDRLVNNIISIEEVNTISKRIGEQAKIKWPELKDPIPLTHL